MADITLSKAVRSNLLNLQSTAALMGKTQERLATGLKVNSALDNPTNFFTASALNSRASDLGQLLDSVSNAVQTIAAADQGISALTKLVETAQATARQALQTPATVDTTTTTAATAATVVGGAFTAVDFENSGANDGSISFDIDLDNDGVQSISITYAEANAGAADAGAVTASELAALINTELNTAFSTTGVNYATVNGSGGIDITSNTTGTTSEVTITNFTAANGATGSGLANATDTGSAASSTTTSGPNPKRDELRLQYNELLGQIDQLVNDAGFNGVNLLDGDDLSVLFNEDGSSKLDISGVTLDSTGLGLATIASAGFDTDTAINTTLDDLSDAIDTLRTQASTFGANLSVVETRQDFTKNMINVLETGAANLTLADTNEEAANLLALQTRQQLSSTALSLASQADQQVLRLF
jgi:flagellin